MATRAHRKSKTLITRRSGPRAVPLPNQRVPEIGLGRLLREADMTFNRTLREELARYDVTFSQYQHLWQLWKEDGLPQFELSRRIGIETASSTSVIDQLERQGLISRRRDAVDRRRIVVSLTPAGKRLETPLDACAVAVNRRARALLSSREITVLYDMMRKVIAGLRHK